MPTAARRRERGREQPRLRRRSTSSMVPCSSRWSCERLVKPDGRERGAVHPLVRERVRAHLHRDGADLRVAHPREQRLQLGGLGRREAELLVDARDPRAGGAEHARALAGRRGDRLEQVGRRGLAVRPGDAEHAQSPATGRRGTAPRAARARGAPARPGLASHRAGGGARRAGPTAPRATASGAWS